MTKSLQQQKSGTITLKYDHPVVPNTTKKEVFLYHASKTEKRIKDFNSKQELIVLNALFFRWANFIGAAEPSSIELNTLSTFAKENFGFLNQVDLEECINLISTASLDTDAEAYGKLTPLYVSKVFKAYQNHKSSVISKVRTEIEKVEAKKVRIPTPQERISIQKKLFLHAKDYAIRGEFFDDFGSCCYYYLWVNKYVTMPDELKEKCLKYGNEMFSREKKQQINKAVIQNMSFKTATDLKFDKESKVNAYARDYAVNHWLKTIDIDAVIKNISIEKITKADNFFNSKK